MPLKSQGILRGHYAEVTTGYGALCFIERKRCKVQREGSNTRQEKRPQNVTISEALFYVAMQENHFWP